MYLALNSDKQEVAQGVLRADVLHNVRHSICACIAATPAASLSKTPTLGNFVFNVSL
jgi:hypothetical protein